jgi:heterodisulfide reductase subunit B2
MLHPYFPGCTLATKARSFDVAARSAAAILGAPLSELPKWNCCGATFPLATDNLLNLVGPTRILARAGQQSDHIVTLCAACYNVLKRTDHFLAAQPEKLQRINDFTEEPYRGGLRVLHLLEVLRDEIGFELVKGRVSHPLTGQRLAPYYGCLLLRPGAGVALDDPENPSILENLLSALGADVVDYSHKTECCGSYLVVSEPLLARDLSFAIIEAAQRRKATAIVTSCPLCQFNLESRQAEMARAHPGFQTLPVVYFTELLAQALGAGIRDQGPWIRDQQQNVAIADRRDLLGRAV